MNAQPHHGAFAAQFPKRGMTNAQQMPGGMDTPGIDWARAQHGKALVFLSTTEFSIDAWRLAKQTKVTTSAEKSHAFAKSSCSHRLMFFFSALAQRTRRRWGSWSPIVVTPRRTSSSSDNSDTFSGSILSAANFGILRDSSLRSLILFMIFSSFTSLSEWLPAPAIL